ncbi:MAG TPA: hypothetical protein VG621_01200 [Candidatus Paceibacterota bacterium]|nr:hypothetical protein [Candidatus Paceibacterota bacterium]
MHSELKWFLLLFAALWVAWLVTGGPSRIDTNRTHPFIEQPSPLGNGQIYTFQQLKTGTQP